MGLGFLKFRQFVKEFCWPTLSTLIGVALLLGLGTWQLQRLSYKESILTKLSEKINQPVQSIEHLLAQPITAIQEAEYQRVKLTGLYLHDQEMRLLSKTFHGQSGYHLITPFVLTSGSTVLVDRGWVPAKGHPETKRPMAEQTIIGFLRMKTSKTAFTPANNLARNELFYIEPEEIAHLKKLTTLLLFFVIEEVHPHQEGFPRATGLTLQLRNHHLQYAITWYTLALILAGIYIIYIRKKL